MLCYIVWDSERKHGSHWTAGWEQNLNPGAVCQCPHGCHREGAITWRLPTSLSSWKGCHAGSACILILVAGGVVRGLLTSSSRKGYSYRAGLAVIADKGVARGLVIV